MSTLRGAGGRKPTRSLLWEIVRPLKLPDDLPLLQQASPAPRKTISQIRHSHHQLARLLATGTDQNECSLITGYAPAYISVLKTDDSFQELMAYYATQAEQRHIDVLDRMRSLGLSTLEELQQRLEENPESYSLRELMEQAELMLVKPMQAARSTVQASGTGGGVSVAIKFVTSEAAGTTIDVTPEQPALLAPVDRK